VKHWEQPQGDDATLLAAIAKISDPLQMLECLIANKGVIGTDPSYSDINTAIWTVAERIIEQSGGMRTYVITANDSVEAIVIGTEERAEQIKERLAGEYFERWRQSNWGRTEKDFRSIVYYAARPTPIRS
jgi:hypothetical protein